MQTQHSNQPSQQRPQQQPRQNSKQQAATSQPMIDPSIVKSLIDNDIHNTLDLERILLEEKQSMQNRDAKQLKSALESKKQLLAIIDKNSDSRKKMLAALGLQNNADGWQQLVSSTKLEQPWQDLKKRLIRCQELNNANELIVNRSRQSVNHVLNILRGTLGEPKLYNACGDSGRSSGAGRTFVTA